MSDVDQSGPETVKAKAKLPLKRRLKAWWEGETLELKRKGGQPGDSGEDSPAQEAKPGIEIDRLTLLRRIWGEEQTQPGDKEFLIELIKPLGLAAGNTLVQLGGDMGLTGRAAVDQFNCFARVMEADEELVAAGKKILFAKGEDKKVELIAYDPPTYDYPENSTDHLFAKQAFWPYKEKAELLSKAAAMVRPGGQFLLTDYMLGEGASAADLGAPASGGASHENLWTPAAYEDHLGKLKLDVRINEDVTERFQHLIAAAWADFATPQKIDPFGTNTKSLVLDLAETWVGRSCAMAEGKLRIHRILAIRNF